MTAPNPYGPAATPQPQRLPYIAWSNAGLAQLWLLFWVLLVLAAIPLFTEKGPGTASAVLGFLAVLCLIAALSVNSIARELRGYRSQSRTRN